jgi:hypothetical protein
MIKHIKCDIFESGADVICHQVNCQGVMGSGIAKQVREKYPWVYAHYKALFNDYKPHDLLGARQLCYINERQAICNCFGQENYDYDGKCYTSYEALEEIFGFLKEEFKDTNTSIAIPYLMGCARGGGNWEIVYKIIYKTFQDYDGDILICEYNGG